MEKWNTVYLYANVRNYELDINISHVDDPDFMPIMLKFLNKNSIQKIRNKYL